MAKKSSSKNISQGGEVKELLKPKYDIVFQSLFSDKNRKETGYLISAILGKKIKVIKVETEVSEMRELPEEKIGRLDLLAETENNELVHIELQLFDYHNTISRLLYSQDQKISKQLIRGDDYNEIKRTITIGMLNYELEEIKHLNKMHTIWKLREEENRNEVLTELQELHIIEMPKAKIEYEKNPNNILAQWILFILNPNEKEVKFIMKENEEIKKTNNKLENLSEDEHMRKRAEILSRWELEEKWNKASLEKYVTEKTMKKGLAKGKKLGEKIGKKIGEKNKEQEIAKRMLEEKMEIDLITKLTGLSKAEIQKLKQQNN